VLRRRRPIILLIVGVLCVVLGTGCANKGAVASVIYNHVASLRSGTVRSSTELWADEAKQAGRRMAEIYARFDIPYPIGAKILSLRIERNMAIAEVQWHYSHNLRPETYFYELKRSKGKWRIADCLPAPAGVDSGREVIYPEDQSPPL
jgi:hypothetical protein